MCLIFRFGDDFMCKMCPTFKWWQCHLWLIKLYVYDFFILLGSVLFVWYSYRLFYVALASASRSISCSTNCHLFSCPLPPTLLGSCTCLYLAICFIVVPCCYTQVAQMGGQPEQGSREQVGHSLKSMNVYDLPSLICEWSWTLQIIMQLLLLTGRALWSWGGSSLPNICLASL